MLVMIKNLLKISRLKINKKQEFYFKRQFIKTLETIDKFNELDTSNVEFSFNPVKTENILREDEIRAEDILSQDEALSNARRTYNGYFVSNSVKNET